MGLLDMCCPKKPKKSLDYVIKWVEDTDKTIKDLSDTVQELNKWKEDISEETLRPIFNKYAETYPWDNVPAFNTKADKVENVVVGHLASLDENGNLQDSGKKPADFVPNVSGATEGNLPQFDANGNIQDSGKKPADFAPASGSTAYAAANHDHAGVYSPVDHNHDNVYAPKTHTHFTNEISGLDEYLAALSARVSALEHVVTPPSWETVEEIILGTPGTNGQNRYSQNDNNLFDLTHYADYRIGDRVRLAGITDPEIVVEGEILAKSTGPQRILLSIDLSSITNNGYHYNLQKVAASNNK